MNEHWLMSLEDAREKVKYWKRDNNENHPQSSFANVTPVEFAAQNVLKVSSLNRDFEAAKNDLHIQKLADRMDEKRGADQENNFHG